MKKKTFPLYWNDEIELHSLKIGLRLKIVKNSSPSSSGLTSLPPTSGQGTTARVPFGTGRNILAAVQKPKKIVYYYELSTTDMAEMAMC